MLLDSSTTRTADLIEQAQNGSHQAYATLYERHYGLVRSVLIRQGVCQSDVEDLIQDIFIQVLLRLTTLRSSQYFTTWLAHIARNLAVNHFRRRKNVHLRPDIEDPYCRPAYNAFLEERLEALHSGMAKLKAKDSDILTTKFLHDKKVAQISQESGLPLGTVKRRLHVALKRLAGILQANP
jgi:RNA polymerase sigma-70 factor (ECF subfamily)